MKVYLICEDDTEKATNHPFGISYDSTQKAFAGFKSIELANYFIKAMKLNDYKVIEINDMPKNKLINYNKVIIFETEANVHSIFTAKIKTLVNKAKDISKLLTNPD